MEVAEFPSLSKIPGLLHGFTEREFGLDVVADREIAVSRLRPFWERHVPQNTWGAEQVHGSGIDIVGNGEPKIIKGVDGLIVGNRGAFIEILVADCAAVYVVDPVREWCGLFHSGRKGTELGIVSEGISLMEAVGGCEPRNLIVQVAPCIRPPLYEIDFPRQIRGDCLAAGVPENQFFDCGTCTGQEVDRYYSYRIEKGKTGRMLAFVGFEA